MSCDCIINCVKDRTERRRHDIQGLCNRFEAAITFYSASYVVPS